MQSDRKYDSSEAEEAVAKALEDIQLPAIKEFINASKDELWRRVWDCTEQLADLNASADRLGRMFDYMLKRRSELALRKIRAERALKFAASLEKLVDSTEDIDHLNHAMIKIFQAAKSPLSSGKSLPSVDTFPVISP